MKSMQIKAHLDRKFVGSIFATTVKLLSYITKDFPPK